jgi:quercetin dioxygenase-like cupin family protein
MKRTFALWAVVGIGVLLSQTPTSTATIINQADSKWTREAKDGPGEESIFLREDAKTGGMELLVRFPAGHVFAPHWHSANERIVMLEGRLSFHQKDQEKAIDPGGYAFLPAHEVQRMTCVSKTRCAFYVHWDGKLDNHAVK